MASNHLTAAELDGYQELQQQEVNGGAQNSDLPRDFKETMEEMCGENDIVKVIEKKLHKTDVEKNNNRLSMPFSQIESFDFLRESEIEHLQRQNTMCVSLIHKPTKNDNDNGVALKESTLQFRQWDMHKGKMRGGKKGKKCSTYVLKAKWNEIVQQNELKAEDEVQIWASRKAYEDKLCMALVVSRKNLRRNTSVRQINNVQDASPATNPLGIRWGRTQKRTMRYEVAPPSGSY